MKKNGFVFVESIVVLVVVALSLAMMISSYSLITRKTREKEYYNKASDKYLLYAINKLGTTDDCNYVDSCHISDPNDKRNDIDFSATKSNCATTKIGSIIYDCGKVFDELNISRIYFVYDVYKALNKEKKDASGSFVHMTDAEYYSYYDSGTIEYMKTLKKCAVEDDPSNCSVSIKYLIGVFKIGDEYHYASIELGQKEESEVFRCPINDTCENTYTDFQKYTSPQGDYTSKCTSSVEQNEVCGTEQVGDSEGNPLYRCHASDLNVVTHEYNNPNLPAACSCSPCYEGYILKTKTCTVYTCPTKMECRYTYGDYQPAPYGPKQDECVLN